TTTHINGGYRPALIAPAHPRYQRHQQQWQQQPLPADIQLRLPPLPAGFRHPPGGCTARNIRLFFSHGYDPSLPATTALPGGENPCLPHGPPSAPGCDQSCPAQCWLRATRNHLVYPASHQSGPSPGNPAHQKPAVPVALIPFLFPAPDHRATDTEYQWPDIWRRNRKTHGWFSAESEAALHH